MPNRPVDESVTVLRRTSPLMPDGATIERFLAHCHRRRYPSRTDVFRPGDPASTLYYVVSGSVSIIAENPVAVVERTVAKKGTAQLAKAYLDYLYSEEAQEIAAKHAIRPRSETVLKKYADTFKPLKQFTVAKYFGSLTEAQKVHFNDGGQFDKLYTPGAK